jgi:hypothetical protein
MKKILLCLLVSTFLFCGNANSEVPFIIKRETFPAQYSGYSCQSHFFALALNRIDSKQYPVNNFEELRELEKKIRSYIKKIAPNSDVKHHHWQKAITHITGNQYKLKIRTFRDFDQTINSMIDSIPNNIELVELGPILTLSLSEKIYGISITEINGKEYGIGHVVSIHGVLDGMLLISNSSEEVNGQKKGMVYIIPNELVKIKDFRDESQKQNSNILPIYKTYEIVKQ